ncbi:MAG: protein kinase [Gallionella sp.]
MSASAPSDWRPFPLTLDNDTCGYDLGNILGAGAYAQVYNLLKDDKEFALKMELFGSDKEPNASALTEAYILRQTRHPHIIRCYDAFFECDGTNNGRLRLILERATQGDMTHWLAVDHLSDKDKLDALFGILSGLSFLHSKQIIHCDLKPANILFHQGVAKIADFGLSVRDIGLPKDTNVQTVVWRSPEVFNFNPYFTTKIDMWSVGAIIWDLFGDGTLLFEPIGGFTPELTDSDIYLGMMERISKPIILPPTPYKVELEALMRACFIVDPINRISADEALQLPLFSTYEIPEGLWLNSVKTYPLPNKETEQWLLDITAPLGLPIQAVSLAVNIFERVPNIIDTNLTASACLLIGDMLLGPDWPIDINDFADYISRGVEELVQEMAEVCNKVSFQLYPDQWVTTCKDLETQKRGIEGYVNDVLSDEEDRMWVERRFGELCVALQ